MARFILAVPIAWALVAWPSTAAALERLCDPAHEDCRAPLLALIDGEQHGIDVAFWFMEDTRYASALLRAHARGVRIRALVDTRANSGVPVNAISIQMLKDAGIPIREKVSSGILHWKMMLFAGQRTVQFSGANYSGEAFTPAVPYADYVDEVIYFTDRPSWVSSFMTKYDDVWTDTQGFDDYANVTSRSRVYPQSPIDPELNFPPGQSFRDRSVAAYRAESVRIDSIMYRITDRAHTDALIEAARRGVKVRLITEPFQYRDASRLWHAWNVDRLYMAGLALQSGGEPAIHIRHRRHLGLNHEKLSLLVGQRMSIFGSSNWTSPSSDSQVEHNAFTTDLAIFDWVTRHFERKWFNHGPVAETKPFAPLSPDTPHLLLPVQGSTNISADSVTLQWNGGPWAHRYDVYLGTNPSDLTRVVTDLEMGPYVKTWSPPDPLRAGTVYYWKVVGRTMAGLERTSVTCSFRTAGGGGSPAPPGSCSSAPAPAPDPVPVDEPQDVGEPEPPQQDPPDIGSDPDDPALSNPPPARPVRESGGAGSGAGSVVDMPTRRPTPNGTYTGSQAVPRPD